MKTPSLTAPPVYVVLLDSRGAILDVSTKSVRPDGNSKSVLNLYPVGKSYLDLCEDDGQAEEVQKLLKRKISLISFVLPYAPPKRKQWFVIIGVPVSSDPASGSVLMHVDIAAWVPQAKASEETHRANTAPVGLSPSLIQDTIAKAPVQQFGTGVGEVPAQPSRDPEIDMLSPRQREVLLLIGAGKSNAEIAAELSCSLNTVKRHVTAVLQKLRLPNRTRAAMVAHGLSPGRK